MVSKENHKWHSRLLLLVLPFGFVLATYNLLSPLSAWRGFTSDPLGLDWAKPVTVIPEKPTDIERSNVRYHVAMTANDALYSRWQCRIMYYYYLKIKDGPGSDMGGFTRILHSGKPDSLMNEIPTFVVDPLPKGMDHGYVVLHRPWAFVQWLNKTTIEEDYILMAEPDHIFVRPLPNLAHGDKPVAYPFSYIRPQSNGKIMRKYYPKDRGPLKNIDPVGNSPVIIKKYLLKEIAPTWMNMSIRMKHDKETDKALGWVLEMYGYAVASALHDVRHDLRKEFMVQPPYGVQLDKKYIVHYTYGCDFTWEGRMTARWTGDWQFNKRRWYSNPPPKNLSLPPPGVPESVVELVERVNEATANIPGWDDMV